MADRDYGSWWHDGDARVDWYDSIRVSRSAVHEACKEWCASHNAHGPVLEVGCGASPWYGDLFQADDYTGVDLAPEPIKARRLANINPRHRYIAGVFPDCIQSTYPLVIAHAVVDHAPDPDALLRQLSTACSDWLYVTLYRGYFPDLDEHKMSLGSHDIWYNDLSVKRVRMALPDMLSLDISLFPLPDGRRETLIVGRKRP